jgi:hypothetical protein
MDPENHVPRTQYPTPRPASSMPGLIATGLAAVLVVLGVILLWSTDMGTNTAVTDNSPRVERAPSAPPAVRPHGDLTQPVPKAPAQ